MLDLIPDSTYADTLERVLYNGTISGMSLDGTHFFYLNPLEILPDACRFDQDFKYVKPLRPQWLSCACCPPNLIRLLASVHRYLYTVRDDAIYVNLYVSSEGNLTQNGRSVFIRQETDYPWKGEIRFPLKASFLTCIWHCAFRAGVPPGSCWITPVGSAAIFIISMAIFTCLPPPVTASFYIWT